MAHLVEMDHLDHEVVVDRSYAITETHPARLVPDGTFVVATATAEHSETWREHQESWVHCLDCDVDITRFIEEIIREGEKT